MIKQKVFHYYQDAGHGWLKVPRELLARLGILDKISSYSYQKNNWVYLEEDCDMSLFLSKYSDLTSGVIPVIRDHHCDHSSIRNYRGFTLEKTGRRFLIDGKVVNYRRDNTVSRIKRCVGFESSSVELLA